MQTKPDRVERALQAAQADLDGGLLLPSDDRAVLAAEVRNAHAKFRMLVDECKEAELRIEELHRYIAVLESQPHGQPPGQPRRSWLIREDKPQTAPVCPACREPFRAGQTVTLVALGPGENPESRERARTGKTYNAVALEAHYACVTGLEDRA